MQTTLKNRTIFCRDNLDILRGINTESIDLIYLDPPFNKNKQFTAPIGSEAEGASFRDIFREEDVKDEWVHELREDNEVLANYLDSTERMGYRYNKYYLVYMARRLMEMHRILKPTGSIYLHCDPTMSHYLKLLMDCIFGEKNFRNEVTWKRTMPHNLASRSFDTVTDIIFFYSKNEQYIFKTTHHGLPEEELNKKFPNIEEETGRRYQHHQLEQSQNVSSRGEYRVIGGKKIRSDVGWRWSQKTIDERLKVNPHLIYWTKAGRPRYKNYADAYLGRMNTNLWDDIPGLGSSSKERVGYPTQKPLTLLERIIKASTNEGDLVLDPFCGCATTCVASERLGRRWVGIDVSPKAYELVQMRLKKEVERKDEIFKQKVIYRTDLLHRTDLAVHKLTKREIKSLLYGKQQGKCKGCRILFPYPNLELDHITPRTKGGWDNVENLQLLCGSCNNIKGDRSMDYLLAQLKGR